MAIPSYEEMLRPILELTAKGEVTRQSVAHAMCDYYRLSTQEREARIKDGSTEIVVYRVSWALTYLKNGGLVERVAPKTYRATKFGKQYMMEHPKNISIKDLKAIPTWTESRRKQTQDTDTDSEPTDIENESVAPLEAILGEMKRHNAELKSRLMGEILRQDPAFFENLVLDVLVAMGYGGSRADAAEHLGRSGDEGIDGCIKQDPLGLDLVLVQAKRYKPENAINREAIQSFIGAMSGRGVNKGVFITTSYFNANAKEFVSRGTAQKVILIDGDMLLDLMLEHHVGTRVQEAIEILDLDQNYFNDED
jgi:restriction system protein